ncbi:Hypothetical predicted protein [Paramuricea clavata]|uniref:Uncharacterized protein n=1 Tax=Paramuricea clavata TaxID=317549 RepID=A0A6S7FX83_PARCT|nr:Hypothetical predicted protein [Paramuricea clavata]
MSKLAQEKEQRCKEIGEKFLKDLNSTDPSEQGFDIFAEKPYKKKPTRPTRKPPSVPKERRRKPTKPSNEKELQPKVIEPEECEIDPFGTDLQKPTYGKIETAADGAAVTYMISPTYLNPQSQLTASRQVVREILRKELGRMGGVKYTETLKNLGSNWRILNIEAHYVNTALYKPLRGSSYMKLPEDIKNPKNGLLNIKNGEDTMCFMWCHVRHLRPKKDRATTITQKDKDFSMTLNYSGIDFPVKTRKGLWTKLLTKVIPQDIRPTKHYDDDWHSGEYISYVGRDATRNFIQAVLNEARTCNKIMKGEFNKPMKLTEEEEYQNADYCHICEKWLDDKDPYLDDIGKLDAEELPSTDEFYSTLYESGVNDEDYERAQKVWNHFGMKTMRDYHDFYLETDVLLLADIFESFRMICLSNYKLDPAHYLSAPGLRWDAFLKQSGNEIELVSDMDMFQFFEKGMCGGTSYIAHRIFTHTDSLMYEIKTDDIYEDFARIGEKLDCWDNSDYLKDNPYYSTHNKKVIGKFKDEAEGVPIVEFVGFRSKMYSYVKENGKGGMTAKGVKNSGVRGTVDKCMIIGQTQVKKAPKAKRVKTMSFVEDNDEYEVDVKMDKRWTPKMALIRKKKCRVSEGQCYEVYDKPEIRKVPKAKRAKTMTFVDEVEDVVVGMGKRWKWKMFLGCSAKGGMSQKQQFLYYLQLHGYVSIFFYKHISCIPTNESLVIIGTHTDSSRFKFIFILPQVCFNGYKHGFLNKEGCNETM